MKVTVDSEEYGHEEFEYKTQAEAEAAFNRLVDRARQAKDWVTRTIRLITQEEIVG